MLELKKIVKISTQLSLAAGLMLGFTAPSTVAAEPAGEAKTHMVQKKANAAGFNAWVADFKKRAVSEYDFSSEFLDKAFANAQFKERVVELDNSQPYSKMTFATYRERVIPQSRIDKARKKYRENRQLLNAVGQKYGVQPRFIVALWAIESNFGENMGGFGIIESLATLAYEGRRAEFFEKELVHALNIIKHGDVTVEDMKGSWAGAMGQTQFMPSSYRELAVDYDGDGKRDIWNTKADAFASIANYLSKRGWDDETTWGREVTLPNDFDHALLGRKVTKTIRQWHDLGVKTSSDGTLPLARGDLDASIVAPEDDAPPYFMVYGNYNVIMKWNRSTYFASAVGLLSDAIGNQ